MPLFGILFVNLFLDFCLAFLIVNAATPNDCTVDLVESYFQEKSTKVSSVIGCSGKSGLVKLARTLATKSRPISFLDVSTKNLKVLKSVHQHIGVVLDGNCPNVEELLVECGRLKLFDVRHHWLIITSDEGFVKKFDNVDLNVDADIQVALRSSKRGVQPQTWAIIDVYNAASQLGGVLNHTTIGSYNKDEGYTARIKESKYWARKNLTGVTFRTMVVLPVPFDGTLEEYLDSDADREINTFNRFHQRLQSFCKNYYNFSWIMNLSNSWGYMNPDGTFDGMVGGLERGQLDFGSSCLFVRSDRAQYIDYGRNTWTLRAVFIFRNPKKTTSFEVFLRPLSTSIWLLTGFFAVMSMIVLKLVLSFESKKNKSKEETSWSLSVITTLGHFCQQGAPHTPSIACGRIITITILILSIIIYQFYSASIVSSLLQKPSTSIRGLGDILRSQMKVGCEDILYTRDYLKHTNDKNARDLYLKKIVGKGNTSNFLQPENGLDLVEKGNYAFHVEVDTAYPIIERTFPDKAICELREVPLFRIQPMHANYQKESPFRDLLDTCLQRLAENGVLYRERRHWHPRRPACVQSSQTVTFNVGLDELYPALLVLLIGMAASVVILVIEKQYQLLKDRGEEYLKKGRDQLSIPFIN